MNYEISQSHKPKNAIILQGDWEGGISHVALDMMSNGVDVTKVILNCADWIYNYRKVPTVTFDQPLGSFKDWLRDYITKHVRY